MNDIAPVDILLLLVLLVSVVVGAWRGLLYEVLSLMGWVAAFLVAQWQAVAMGAWLPLGITQGHQEQGGIGFAWREEVASTPNPAFRRVDIFVHDSQSPEHRLAHVTGFVVNPPGRSP